MSATDLKSSATTWGISEVLDSPNSVQFLTREKSLASETGDGGGLAKQVSDYAIIKYVLLQVRL